MPPNQDDASGDSPTDQVRCPTCRALQSWSDTCRRCRSDLRLLREVHEAYQQTRSLCLARLRAGRFRAALELARRCRDLVPSAESDRLLAVCSLRLGDWPAAVSLGRRLEPQ